MFRLLPEQIGPFWPLIKGALRIGLPTSVELRETVFANLEQALLVQRLQCWFLLDEQVEVETEKLLAIATTIITEDTAASLRSLYMYSLAALRPVSDEAWTAGLEALAKFGRSQGCNAIVATSKEARVLEIMKAAGAAETRLLTLEIN